MKLIKINKYKNSFEKRIDRFNKSLAFKDLINLLEYCLSNKIYDSNDLILAWSHAKGEIQKDDHLSVYLELLPKLSVSYSYGSRSEEIITPNDPDNDKMSTHIRDFVESYKESKKHYDKHQKSYSWFRQAIVMQEYLEEVYASHLNPGMVIAENLKAIFPEDIDPETEELFEDYSFDTKYALPYQSDLHLFIKLVGDWAIECAELDQDLKITISSCVNDYLDSENRECRPYSHVDPLHFFVSLMRCPRELYYCWINECLLSHVSPWLSSQEQLNAALKCLPFGRGNEPLIFSSESYSALDKSTQKLLLKLWNDAPNIKDDRFVSYRSFLCLVYRAMDCLSEIDAECTEHFKAIVRNISNDRREQYSGCSPFDSECYSEAGFLIDAIGLDCADLALLLCNGNSDYSYFSMMPDEDYSIRHVTNLLNEKQKTFLIAFDKAIYEGFSELGIALLSLYIFSRAIIMKGRFGNIAELLPAIRQSLTLSGAPILKHTLAFVVDIVEQHFNNDPIAMCAAHIFRQYLPQGAELYVLEGGKGKTNTESEVRDFLKSNLGEERWNKLSSTSQNCLISAELQWKNSAVEFGFGIKDWSGLVMTYCKPIEGELLIRFKNFYFSEEYAKYLTGKKLTRPVKFSAGWLLKELKGFDKMPQTLQVLVNNTGIKLAGNLEIVKRLYDIVENYRNVSAHPELVGMKRYAEFKKKLFEDRLMHDFIDIFC